MPSVLHAADLPLIKGVGFPSVSLPLVFHWLSRCSTAVLSDVDFMSILVDAHLGYAPHTPVVPLLAFGPPRPRSQRSRREISLVCPHLI